MYKSKLQELCQKSHWNLPTYNTSKQGLDHNPSFSATVVVNGQSFHTQNFSKSSRDAQNDAAKIAFDYLSIPKLPIPTASSFPQPSQLTSSGSLGATTETDAMNVFRQTFQQNIQGTYPTPQAGDNTSSVNLQVNGSTSVAQQENKFEGVQHLYKSQLQMYAQKRNLVFPVYSCERQGPPHASRFKCRVTIDENVYECPDFFLTLKEAEHAAAKVALMSLSPDGVQQDDPGFYKNLLQELVQKEGFCLPTYDTNRYGEAHCPVFVSTVEIEGEHFKGEEEKTKKHAEMSAAKVAYNALKERKSSQIPLILLPSQQGQEAPNLLSSSSQSDISANVIFNAPINSSLNTIPVQQAEDHTDMTEQRIVKRRKTEDIESQKKRNMESCIHTSKGGLSSSDIYGGAQDTIPSGPYESKSDSSSSSLSSSFTNSVLDSGPSANRISLSCKKVIIYPAKKPIPDGSTLLPMSDDNWVAFSPPEARS